jgi:hypothetical protein
MSVLTVKNSQYVYIGKSIARTASAQVTDPNATGYIADGEVVVLASDGSVYDTAADSFATSPFIQIAQRSGDDILYSPKIVGLNLTAYNGREAAAGQEQVYEIGYTGSTGAIDVTSGLDFIMNVSYKHDKMVWSEQINRKPYFSPATTSAKNVAKDITSQIMKDYVNNGSQVTAVCLNSGSAAAVGVTTLKVVNGSPVVTYSAAATGVVAGTTIRIGVTGSGRGTVIPVYTVKELHPTIADTVILDQAYAGPTNLALPAADHGLVTEGASWGIRLTGKSLSYRKDFFSFMRTRFTVGLSGFGSTTVNKRQEASLGYGDGRMVAQEESFCKGFEGALNRLTVPIDNTTFDAVTTTTTSLSTTLGDAYVVPTTHYDCITLSAYSKNDQTIVSGPAMPTVIKIFTVDAAGTDQLATGNLSIQSALNDWAADTPSKFANLALVEA